MTRDEFMAITARDCNNCLECSSRPCDGCCAGGICDRECHCEDIDDDDTESDYDEDAAPPPYTGGREVSGRWRYAWGEISELVNGTWETQKDRDAFGWWPYERFWTYVTWPIGCVLVVLFLMPLVAFTWEPDPARQPKGDR